MNMKNYVIARNDDIYEAFPDVAMTDSGELICVFLQCEHHVIRKKVSLCITKSSDHGRTWTPKRIFAQNPDNGQEFNCPRISKLKDGTMVIVCDTMAALDVTAGNALYVWKSQDNGNTWSTPLKLQFDGIVPDKYRELSNGRHIVALHRKGKEGKLEQYLYYSDDKGNTWSEPVLVAADERYNLCEACILEVKEGTLVAFLRENSGKGYSCKKAISQDYGLTWEGVYDSRIDCCHRPVVDFLDHDRLLMTYRFAQGGKWGYMMQNLFGAVFDLGTALAKERIEQNVRIFPISYDRSPVSDTGYSGWVELPDHEIYVVNYLVDDAPKAYIKGFAFDKKDIFYGTNRE